MTTSSIDLTALRNNVQKTLERLDEIENVVARAEANEAGLTEISSQIVAGITPTWMQLSPELLERTDWSGIDQTVEQTQLLVEKLYRTALRPREEAVQDRFQRWHKAWGRKRERAAAIQEFLNTADNTQLDQMIQLIASCEAMVLVDAQLQRLVQSGLGEQVRGFDRLQKRAEFLIDALTSIHDLLQAAAALDQILNTIHDAVQATQEPILHGFAEHWLKQQRRSLDQPDAKADGQVFVKLSRELTTGWQQLQPALDGVRHQLQHLGPDEVKLVQREARSVSPWPQNIRSFATDLGKVIERRQQLAADGRRTDDGASITTPILIADLEPLRETCPALPRPSSGSDPQSYLEQLDDAHRAYEEWSNAFTDVAFQLSGLRTRWSELTKRHDLAATVAAATDSDEPANLTALISDHNDLAQAIRSAREELVSGLPPAERILYNRVLDLMGQGVETIDPFVVLTGEEDPAPLLELARRQLINLQITA